LNQRLKDFEAEHSDLKLEVRIKTNIVEYLSVTNSAAPASMPDLIALPYSQMQTAASAGFLHPLDGLTSILQDSDWYAFARELSTVQNAVYGIPFASDTLLTMYRPSVFKVPPSNWESILNSGAKLAYPSSDTNQYLPLSLYLSADGQFKDETGVFALDEDALVRVLSLYQRAHEAGVIPVNIRSFQTDAQSINSYLTGETDLAFIWASSDIGVNSGGYAPLFGLNDVSYSIGDGWVWVFAGSNLENEPLAIELATYLVESDYMAEWTKVSGYLPTRPLALAGWEDDTVKAALDNVLLAAHPAPSPEVISRFGPVMQEALIRIFNGEQAEIVAVSVIENLK
jgi:ABC-type glycerol-3-phosphate transport system substrate-binding protein